MTNKRVTFQGERGAYSEMATLQYFPDAQILPMKTIEEAFESIEIGKADFAVVPIENSIEGSINETYDSLLQTKMHVSGEVYQRIRHCLITNKHTSSTIESVYSHPQALAQCRRYLKKKRLEPIPTYDTAGAVKMIKERKIMNAVTIASKRAADIYKMEILDEGIEDKKNNLTRFLGACPKQRQNPLIMIGHQSSFRLNTFLEHSLAYWKNSLAERLTLLK